MPTGQARQPESQTEGKPGAAAHLRLPVPRLQADT